MSDEQQPKAPFWNHRVIEYVDFDGSVWFQIHEVHYDAQGNPEAYSENGAQVFGDDIAQMRETLARMERSLSWPALKEADFHKSLHEGEQYAAPQELNGGGSGETAPNSPAPADAASEHEEDPEREAVFSMIERAREYGLQVEVVTAFANHVRNGDNIQSAASCALYDWDLCATPHEGKPLIPPPTREQLDAQLMLPTGG